MEWVYPLVNIQKATEHGPCIVDLSMKNGGSIHSYVKLPEGKPPFSYGFPMVFLWFSYGFPIFP